MATKSTSTVREMPEELFKFFSAQFDALTQVIEDAGFPVLHTCQIYLGETEDSLITSSMSATRNLRGQTVCRMAAAAAAQPIMNGVTSVLKDDTGAIPTDALMHLIPLAQTVTDTFISYFTQAMAAHASQSFKESGCSGTGQTEVLMSALAHAVKNLRPEE